MGAKSKVILGVRYENPAPLPEGAKYLVKHEGGGRHGARSGFKRFLMENKRATEPRPNSNPKRARQRERALRRALRRAVILNGIPENVEQARAIMEWSEREGFQDVMGESMSISLDEVGESVGIRLYDKERPGVFR